MPDISAYISELVMGIILLAFAWSFRAWSSAIRETSAEIIKKLEELAGDFHSHKITNENRVTKVETKHEALQRQVDRLTLALGGNGRGKVLSSKDQLD